MGKIASFAPCKQFSTRVHFTQRVCSLHLPRLPQRMHIKQIRAHKQQRIHLRPRGKDYRVGSGGRGAFCHSCTEEPSGSSAVIWPSQVPRSSGLAIFCPFCSTWPCICQQQTCSIQRTGIVSNMCWQNSNQGQAWPLGHDMDAHMQWCVLLAREQPHGSRWRPKSQRPGQKAAWLQRSGWPCQPLQLTYLGLPWWHTLLALS